ncbi:MAG: hypothetical protein ABL888_09600 [Pirellulaceae bacterium]
MEVASLRERNEVLAFIREHGDRIRPRIDDAWLYGAISSYFLECMVLPSASDTTAIHSPCEAASELVRWFEWYVSRVDIPSEIKRIVEQIAIVFKSGNQFVRNCIETGFLEHVLEVPEYRQYFSHWAHDAILSESYAGALRWGVAHTRSNAR